MKRFLLCLVCCGLFFTGCGSTSYFEAVDAESSLEEAVDSENETGIETAASTIFVQVAGAVSCPGVYELPSDSRVFQAIEAAGGLLSNADDSDLNQADLLADGQKILVLTKAEKKQLESAESTETEDGLININTAEAEELMELPGIGQTKADAIVAYRENNGTFAAIEDITNVTGIGEKLFSQIQAYIKV